MPITVSTTSLSLSLFLSLCVFAVIKHLVIRCKKQKKIMKKKNKQKINKLCALFGRLERVAAVAICAAAATAPSAGYLAVFPPKLLECWLTLCNSKIST